MTKLTTTVLLLTLALAAGGCGSQPQVTPTRATANEPTPTPIAIFTAPPTHSATLTPNSQPAPTSTTSPAMEDKTATFEIIPGETTATYSINQVLLSEDNRVATVAGQAGGVEGVFALNYEQPLASQFGLFTANLKLLRSDQPERDEAVWTQWLEADRYPRAAFQPREIRDFPPDARAGEPVRFQLVGDMTIKDVTRQVSWDVTATLKVDRLTGTATTSLRLADFGIPLPTVDGQVAATEGVTVTLDFASKRTTEVPLPSACCGF